MCYQIDTINLVMLLIYKHQIISFFWCVVTLLEWCIYYKGMLIKIPQLFLFLIMAFMEPKYGAV